MPSIFGNGLDQMLVLDPWQMAMWGIAGGLAGQGPSIGNNLGATINSQAELQAAQMKSVTTSIREAAQANRNRQRMAKEAMEVEALHDKYLVLLDGVEQDQALMPALEKARTAWVNALTGENKPRHKSSLKGNGN